jgi:hypothetical protein
VKVARKKDIATASEYQTWQLTEAFVLQYFTGFLQCGDRDESVGIYVEAESIVSLQGSMSDRFGHLG